MDFNVVRGMMQRGGATAEQLKQFDAAMGQMGQMYAQNQQLQGQIQALQGVAQQPAAASTAGPSPTESFLTLIEQQDGGAALKPLFAGLIDAVKQELTGYADQRVSEVAQPVRGMTANMQVRQMREQLVGKYGPKVAELFDPMSGQVQQYLSERGPLNVEQVLWNQHGDRMAELMTESRRGAAQAAASRTMEGFGAQFSEEPGVSLGAGAEQRDGAPMDDRAIAQDVMARMAVSPAAGAGGHNDGEL